MLEFFLSWYRRNFSDPQAVLLAFFLVATGTVVLVMAKTLAPFFAAVILAYLLEGAVQRLEALHLPRSMAVVCVFLVFLLGLIFLVLGLIPVLSHQLTDFIRNLPSFINKGQMLLSNLPEAYPQFVSAEQVQDVIAAIRTGLTDAGQYLLSLSLASIPAIVIVLVYLIVVPLLVFFLLKDKQLILRWVDKFLPAERNVLNEMWREMDHAIGNYVRGKFSHIVIVTTVNYLVFALMRFEYAALLAVLVGLSVIVPYIGAAVVTLPVAIAGYAQWGMSDDFLWLMVAFAIIQALDGNVLVPLLFSEAVSLHPVSIIVAVLVFGDIWGFWGLFFAIPLATLVKCILNIWPIAYDNARSVGGEAG
jgi:putative permease